MPGQPKSAFELVAPLTPEAIEARCRARGLRVGRTRRVVARVVAGIDGRFDFDLVFARARALEPQISRGTIYLTLRRFLSVGVIRMPAARRSQTLTGTQHV